MGKHSKLSLVCISYVTFLLLDLQVFYAAANDNITSSSPLFPNETLLSSNQIFELGFFSPDSNSNNMYIGLWFTNTSLVDILWVANRNEPLGYSDRSASLTIGSDDGNLKLLDGQGKSFWATNVSTISPSSSSGSSFVVVLLDSGNLVLRDTSSGINLWESFDYPSDTLLQTMKMEINVITGNKQFLTCWKSNIDPSPGDFVVGGTSDTPPQAFIWINGSTPYWRSGPWDKTYVNVFTVQQDTQQGTTYFSFNKYNSSLLLYMRVSSNGSLHIMYTNDRTKGWTMVLVAPRNLCDKYGNCGPFGVCNELNSPVCSCLEGFVPKSMEEWSRGNWSRGCTRVTELNCERNTTSSEKKQDIFLEMNKMKLPDSSYYVSTISVARDCSSWCMNNCSCLAYSYVSTIGCMTWSNELIDVQKFSDRLGEDLFLRLAHKKHGDSLRKKHELVASLAVVVSIIILGAAVGAICTRRAKQKKSFNKSTKRWDRTTTDGSSDVPQGLLSWKEQLKSDDGQEFPVFDFDSIIASTNNFSSENKLGQGGFGSVYKGKLQDGKNVAVKRLSSNSGQGVEEFKTEILLISKLQHRNLVRLIGCCIEEEEKILIYEYMSNRSLDTFIFHPMKKMELNWEKRFQIIQGIARGLLYLHQDSHLRVIHRDLKASNVLLDEKFNPKISDFGLARMFEGTQDLVNTRRIVGTFGYMAPEYAMRGIFSEKSDIYSFGVLLLEIVSSKKNTSFNYNEQDINLSSYTWKLWREGRAMDLLDDELLKSSSLVMVEVEKCIQVGLMCVQDHAVDRPHVSSVIQMLSGELINLSEPKEPGCAFQINSSYGTPPHQERTASGQEVQWSANNVMMSAVEGR